MPRTPRISLRRERCDSTRSTVPRSEWLWTLCQEHSAPIGVRNEREDDVLGLPSLPAYPEKGHVILPVSEVDGFLTGASP